MNNKGQGVEVILYTFIAVIVGIILFQAISQQVGTATNTVVVANSSIGDADNDTPVYFTDYRAFSDVVVYNESGSIVPSNNYSVSNNFIYNGALSVQFTPLASPAYHGYVWNVSATAQPLTYIADSGGRSMALLIGIFFALAIAVAALYPVYQGKLMEMLGR